MIRWTRFYLAVLFVTCFIYLKFNPSQDISQITRSPIESIISPKSIFIYKVFLDQRGGSNILRVLAINRCHTENESLLSVKINGTFMSLIPKPIEGSCPWKWASGCTFATYIHELEVPPEFEQDDVMIHGKIQYAVKSIIPVNDNSTEGLTVCVPPIYWYTDWTKLIFFIEWWKGQNITKFIFYYQSSTSEVKEVLDYYEKEGIIELVPWPLLPSLGGFNPNDEVYRLAHSLAHNDCILRANTEFVTIVDVDEIIVPKSLDLMAFIQLNMHDMKVGALEFEHRVLCFYPPLAPLPFNYNAMTYDGIHRTVYKNITGPPKIIVRRSSIHRISTHHVISFLGKNITVPISWSEALLLHSRYNYVGVKTKQKEILTVIVKNSTDFQEKLQIVRDEIFPTGAVFNEATQRVLGACLAKWRESQNNCKAPATACYEIMKDLETWVETKTHPYGIV